MKQLVLIRHGKSSWKDPALSDLKRPLKKRGERDAAEMARRLISQELQLDKVYSSPALRATRTLDLMTEKTGFARGLIAVEPDLYTFNYEDLMLFLKKLGDKKEKVALVGHNPAIRDLVNFLTLEDIANIPTCGIAILDLDTSKWSEIRAGGATLRYYDYPKNAAVLDSMMDAE